MTFQVVSISIMAALSLGLPSLAYSQQGHGGVPIRILQFADDTNIQSRCIDPSKDRIWLTLRRVVTRRSKGWFTQDADVSLVINAHVQTDPPQTNGIAYPLAAKA